MAIVKRSITDLSFLACSRVHIDCCAAVFAGVKATMEDAVDY
jgi:hypothetical protein